MTHPYKSDSDKNEEKDERKGGSKEAEHVQELVSQFNKLEALRRPYEKVWDDITEYVMPSQGSFMNRGAGNQAVDPERQSRRRLESTATIAVRALMARITAEMTGTSIRWFDYRDEDPIIDKRDDVRRCLQALSDRVYNILNAGAFRTAHIESTLEWIAYGTSCMETIEDPETNDITFRCIPLREIYITTDKNGAVDIVNRKFTMNYRQMCQFFGHCNLPDKLHQDCESDPFKEFEILHTVQPNENYNPKKLRNTFFKYRSCYVLLKHNCLLKEGYYQKRPYIVFRFWVRPGEAYGGSPVMDCLADIRLLNVLEAASLRIIQRAAEPPMLVEDDSVVLPLRVVPNGINIGGMRDGRPTIMPMFPNPGNEGMLEQKMEQKRQVIRSALFVDPLINREQSIRTASEVQKRSNEEMIGFTPFLGRYEVEYLINILDFVLDWALRNDKSIEIPNILDSRIPNIIFSAPLAKTQRGQELQNNVQFGQMLQNLAQVSPDILMHVNFDNYLSNLADLLSVKMDIIKDPREVAMMKMQQQMQQEQQMKQQQQMEQAKMMQGAIQAGSQAVQAGSGLLNSGAGLVDSGTSGLSNMAKAGLVGRTDVGLPMLDPSAGYTPY